MRFFDELGKGFSTQWRGLEFLVRNNLWYYFLFPVLISALMFIAGMYSMSWVRDWLSDWVKDWLGIGQPDGWLTTTLGWLVDLASWLLMFLITYFFLGSLSKYMTLIVLSPILALLSEKVEEKITGKKYPFVFSHFIKDVLRGILIVFRNMFLEYSIVLLVLLIGFIPVIGWIVGLLSFPFLYALSAYFMGFSMMDYTCERHRMRVSQGAAFISRHKGFAIGNGIVFSLLLMIPVLGIMLAPIMSVTAATIGALEFVKAEEQQKARAQNPQPQMNPQQAAQPGFEELYKKYYGDTPNQPPQS